MSLSPDAADALFDEIASSFERGERDKAMRLAVSALEQGLDEPLVLLLVAEVREAEGRVPEGIELLRQAVAHAPDEPEVWYCLGTMLIRHGYNEEGLSNLNKALSLRPDLLPALDIAATVSYRQGHLTRAEEYYRRITALDPQRAEPLAALAAIAARRRNVRDARSLAEQALALQAGNFTAEMALGRADLIAGSPEDACTRMSRLVDRSNLGDDEKVAVFDLRAEALDALGSTEAAFADYQRRNTILVKKFAPRMEREVAERSSERARRLANTLAAHPRELWCTNASARVDNANPGCGHVFLLSFPRSGTTLLEKVLVSHSKVISLEEVDHLGDVGREWLNDTAGIETLARLTPEQASTHRARYWQQVQETAACDLAGKVLLDKLPLHTLSLPIIAKLFPQAKVLFALRDPRDVVLSCFRRRFQINPAMFELLELQSAARFYHQVMNLADISRAVLPLNVREVRHEDVVQNFEPTIRAALDFIGLGWEPALQQFTDNLPADPRTPSDIQLRRGLNADGLGQWRGYAGQMAPVLGILEPWAVRFGY